MIDTHCHLNDEKLYKNLDEILNDCIGENINKLICASYDLPSSKSSIEIANKYDSVYATIGMHPHDSKLYDESVEQEFISLAKHKKVVAFGEIGLDYYYNLSPKNVQQEVFERQLVLADSLNLPVVIHTREAISDTLNILKNNLNYIKNGLVIHCYNASFEITKLFLDYGFKFSFGGPITYKNSNMPELIKKIPQESYFLETDCPYLAPQTLRGSINVPKNVRLVAEKIADITGETLEEVESFTDKNAKKFFNIF